MLTLTLYSTDGCHLCEQAIGMFYYAKQQNRFSGDVGLKIVDLIDEPMLVNEYAERIPVIHNPLTSKERGWPFTLQELVDWINAEIMNC